MRFTEDNRHRPDSEYQENTMTPDALAGLISESLRRRIDAFLVRRGR